MTESTETTREGDPKVGTRQGKKKWVANSTLPVMSEDFDMARLGIRSWVTSTFVASVEEPTSFLATSLNATNMERKGLLCKISKNRGCVFTTTSPVISNPTVLHGSRTE